ncbi:hypothetical protein [Neorhodopirellula pilleata]|nr:hypothetical protein [Neorhodopirellula pilleata]
MVTKAQKAVQKARRKEKKRQRDQIKEKRKRVQQPAMRLKARLAKQTPEPWEDEPIEDVALFQEHVLTKLSDDLADQARMIREAMEHIGSYMPGDALEALHVIPRRSPYSQWRLFLKGLAAWMKDDLATAQEVWSRLDRHRRPHRIAVSLVMAHCDDLPDSPARLPASEWIESEGIESEGIESGESVTEPTTSWRDELDADLLYHAKLVRRSHVDRVAVRAAQALLRIPNLIEDATVEPEHVEWLREFTKDYQAIEPDFVQALHETTVRRAFCGPFVDMFELAAKHFQGPKHDRKNTLLRFLYNLPINNSYPNNGDTSQILENYLYRELPNNQELPEPLRAAIASHVHMLRAAEEINKQESRGGPFAAFLPPPDLNVIRSCLNDSVQAYPKNTVAWQGLEAVFQDRLNDNDLLKASRDMLESELADVRERWVAAIPDAIEVRLKLVDYLLENDQSDRAKSHVQWLSGTHTDNPLAGAMQWKWNLLEAMRLCRRKSWLSQAPDRLDAAQRQWPKWLSQDWLPYLRAAVDLRAGDAKAMDSFGDDPLSACMKLAAAQRMRVPAAELKSLRAEVDAGLAKATELSTDHLVSMASFFWDLRRTGLVYPAYRMHGTKFLQILKDRFDADNHLVSEHLDDSRVRAALFLMAEEGFFNSMRDLYFPTFMRPDTRPLPPPLAATQSIAILKRRVNWGIETFANLTDAVRSGAQSGNAFERHFYHDLADRFEQRIRDAQKNEFGFLGSMMNRFGSEMDESDNECDCEDCRAARGEL